MPFLCCGLHGHTTSDEEAITFHLEGGITLKFFTRRKRGIYGGLSFADLMLMKNISSYTFKSS